MLKHFFSFGECSDITSRDVVKINMRLYTLPIAIMPMADQCLSDSKAYFTTGGILVEAMNMARCSIWDPNYILS